MAKIGEKIRVLRIKRGYSQAQLAELMGLKRSAISNYEQGIREPDLDTVEAFADFFDVSVADLLGRDDYKHYTATFDTSKANIPVPPHQGSLADRLADSALSEEDDELLRELEAIRRDPELREIYSLSRKTTKDKMKQLRDFVRFVTNGDDDDDTNTP